MKEAAAADASRLLSFRLGGGDGGGGNMEKMMMMMMSQMEESRKRNDQMFMLLATQLAPLQFPPFQSTMPNTSGPAGAWGAPPQQFAAFQSTMPNTSALTTATAEVGRDEEGDGGFYIQVERYKHQQVSTASIAYRYQINTNHSIYSLQISYYEGNTYTRESNGRT